MKANIFGRRVLRGLIVSVAIFVGGSLVAQSPSDGKGYRPDVLGEPYECQTLELAPSGDDSPVATLVRHRRGVGARSAVLYIHGYNDYFFQKDLGDSIVSHDYGFYALDLRRYGRSLHEGQRAFEVKRLSEYYEEIARAIGVMRSEGVADVHILAHSTGCLVASLYLADTKNSDGVASLMLNSPFLDYHLSPFLERVALPSVVALAWIAPDMVVLPAKKAREEDDYAKTLQQGGQYPYDTRWKMPQGYPIRSSWLRAIKRGHRQVQAGLGLDMPILLMSSNRSTLVSKKADPADYDRTDVVLDVEDMWRYGSRLGREVHFYKIEGGMHDLFRSRSEGARRTAYRILTDWLNGRKGDATESR